MKLLFLTQIYDPDDGVLGFVTRWVEGLARSCERVRVVALDVSEPADRPANVDTRAIGRTGRFGRFLRYRRVLREALEGDGFDTVLAHMVPRYALLAAGPARRAGARTFLWYTHKGVDGRLVRAEKVVEKIFTATDESLRLATPKKVVTGHGVDLQHFPLTPLVSEGPPRLLSVGRLTPAKDPLTLLAALSILVSRGFDVHLDLAGGTLAAGDPAYLRTVRETIEVGGLSERVHMHGTVSYREIPSWFGRATLVVNPSLTGSLDKVVLEGMATGRPVLSCNDSIGPLFEELGPRRDWLLFEPGNAAQLADRLEHLLQVAPAGRAELGGRLRAIVERDHEVDTLMKRLVASMGGAA